MMFTAEQLVSIANAIIADQPTSKDPKLAIASAKKIGRAVWGFMHDSDFNGSEYVPRETDANIATAAEQSRELAAALNKAGELLDELKSKRIDGRETAIRLLTFGESKTHGFGPAASELYVHEVNSGHRIADRYFKIAEQLKLTANKTSWPNRVKALMRGAPQLPDPATKRIFGALAHDLAVASAFHKAIAEEYEKSRGARVSRGPVTLGLCVLAWFEGASRVPTPHRRSGEGNARSRPDFYALLQGLWGPGTPRGVSYDTYRRVVRALSDEGKRDRFQRQYRLELDEQTIDQ